jgi:hypothetical protein
MSDQFAGGKHNSVWWPWYSLDHGLGSGFNDWWDSEAPWIDINDGTLSEKILGRAKDFYNLFGDKIDILLPRDASQNR